VTSFALSAAKPAFGTANMASKMAMADPARKERHLPVEW